MGKRFAIALVLTAVLAGCTTGSNARVSTPSPSPAHPSRSATSPTPSAAGSSDPLLYVRMTSLNVMWAATATRVLRSIDRGSHWTDISPTNEVGYGDFFALDDLHAWLVRSSFGSHQFTMFRTADGGVTWKSTQGSLAQGGLGSVTFVDALHGWSVLGLGAAAGSEAIAVFSSTDGGASWHQVARTGDPSTGAADPSGLDFNCDKGSAVFGTPAVGLLPDDCAGGPPNIYRSTDGGSHWKLIPIAGASPQSYFNDVVFLTAADVVMTGGEGSSLDLAVSHDAGLTWQVRPLYGAGSVDFESVTAGWQLGNPVEATSDGGTTWHPLKAPAPPFDPTTMALQNLGKGIAIAWSDSAAYRTNDGARTWRRVTPPP